MIEVEEIEDSKEETPEPIIDTQESDKFKD